MKLTTLIADLGRVTNPRDIDIDRLTQDSREVAPGSAFIATRGSSWDGHAFIATAIAKGASLIVAESAKLPSDGDYDGTWLEVDDALVTLAELSARFYGHPGRDVAVLATTGTNGKTTTTFLLKAIFEAWQRKVGLISTVEIKIGGQRMPTIFTTPPSPEFQRLLAVMRDAGCQYAVVEASSHGLHQHRIAAFPVAVGGFTNLTRDHLDYHGTMEAYEAAKAQLFEHLAERACICIDEPAGQRLAAAFRARFGGDVQGRLLTVSTRGEPADLSAHDVRSDLSGVRCTIVGTQSFIRGQPDFVRPSANFSLTTPLIGRHNVENALVATGMALLAGVPLEVVLEALKTATGAPGRLQRVGADAGPVCFVDYAHTPDALDNVIGALLPLVHAAGGKLTCVFGAGGDRDKGKRPEMAKIAARADRVIATSDNPRTEDPEAILDDIVAGFPAGFAFERIADRAAAIARAVAFAGPNDAVLIAGKGHEDYQIIGTTKHPFDDVAVARAALARRIVWRARAIAHLTEGRLVGPDRTFTGFFTDSRNVVPGGLFIALRGERFDGHDFVAEVIAKGAGGVLVSRAVDAETTTEPPERSEEGELNMGGVGHRPTLIVVADTQAALTTLGFAARTRHAGTFIAITGSVGKTTTKDMTAAALSPFGKVGKTPGNLNNHIGVPLTLLNLDGDEDLVVLELGMSAPGEIARLTAMTRPDVGLVTRAAAAHLQFFPNVEAIADAKGELYEHLPPRATAIANRDDALMFTRAAVAAKVVSFGQAAGSDVVITRAAVHDARLALTLTTDHTKVTLDIATVAAHNAANAAAALTVAKVLNLDLERAARALSAAFAAGKHRLEIVRLGALTVLDDCYNANPTSTEGAIAAFASLCGPAGISRDDCLIVLGTMRELGPEAARFHREVGHAASGVAATVIGTGEHGAELAPIHAADVGALLSQITAWADAHPRGAILLKGSRGERLERVLEHLQRHLGGHT